MESRLARETLEPNSKYTHVVYCTSVFLIDWVTGDSSKSSKVPFCKSVYQVDGDPLVVGSSPADSDVEAEDIFNDDKIGRKYSFSKALWLRCMACNDRGILMPFFSTASTHLLERISTGI